MLHTPSKPIPDSSLRSVCSPVCGPNGQSRACPKVPYIAKCLICTCFVSKGTHSKYVHEHRMANRKLQIAVPAWEFHVHIEHMRQGLLHEQNRIVLVTAAVSWMKHQHILFGLNIPANTLTLPQN